MSARTQVQKVVIPAAGLGTRMLPQTWATPKELLPIVDRPILHRVVEEAADAGLTEVIFVVGPGKESIVDYFRRPEELVRRLEASSKRSLIEPLLKLQERVAVRTAMQNEPLGLGHAVLCARNDVGGEPFAVLLPDELFDGKPMPFEQMLGRRPSGDTGAVALLEVPPEDTNKYGICDGEEQDGLYYVRRAVEKPDPKDAPSNKAIVGRYILPPDTFKILEQTRPGAQGEIQLTDALQVLAGEGRLLGETVSVARFDTGNPKGWLRANAHFGRDLLAD